MKNSILLFIFFLFTFCSFSQEMHYVLVQEMSYSPNDITIEVGDQVSFTHEGLGTHDVNFTTNSLTFEPFDNPVEITSLPADGQYQSEPGLMGIITFDVPGTYNYDCSMYGHASMGMVGSITVNEDGCENNNDIISENFGNFFINDCDALIDYLMINYEYSEYEACTWDGNPMVDLGMEISEICECSCEEVVSPEDCTDEDSIIEEAFDTLSTCAETVTYLVDNYGYTIEEACAWDGNMGNGPLFGGLIVSEFCECTCSQIEDFYGCTDNTACNYDEGANMDDQSCVFPGDMCELDNGEMGIYDENCYCIEDTSTINEFENSKELIKIVDVLGKETSDQGFIIKIYNDGSVEKIYIKK